VIVPAEALLTSAEGKTTVMVVDKDSVAHEREVEVGIREAGKVQITEGVESGDRVVIAGGLGLEDGTKVKAE
jgi:multidrug efflux pump subunit AcrA (membrane-fusion protein)